MTVDAITALRADHEALAGLAATFTDDDWATETGCPGWATRDLLAHLVQLFRQVVDPGSLPPPDPSGSTERTQDRWVEALAEVPPAALLADYRALGADAIAALEGLQGNDAPLDLGDLGTHPLHLVANAFAFDHHTHIRVDLCAPLGPLRHPAPPAEARHLVAAVEWMEAGLPQMSADALAGLGAPVALDVTGPGARTIRVGDPDASPAARVTTSVADLVLWGTRRRPWRDLDVTLDGDRALAVRFCDAVHVF